MKCLNKWNKSIYFVIKIEDNEVILEREDCSHFTIPLSEFNFNYIKIEES